MGPWVIRRKSQLWLLPPGMEVIGKVEEWVGEYVGDGGELGGRKVSWWGGDSLQLTCLLNELNLPCRGQDIHLHFHHPTHTLLSLMVAHAG